MSIYWRSSSRLSSAECRREPPFCDRSPAPHGDGGGDGRRGGGQDASANKRLGTGPILDPVRYGACSFSRTGVTGTTWRLNLSSDSSSPAATPISWERCRIGIW